MRRFYGSLTVSGGRGGLIKAPWFGAQTASSTDSGGFGRAVALPIISMFNRSVRFVRSPLRGDCRGGPHSWLLAVTVRRAPFLELDRGLGCSPSV